MALPSSGVIRLSQIQSEFGGTNPIRLSEYYRNGTFVTSNNTSVPTSGAVDLSDYYGALNGIEVTYELIGAGGAGGSGRADGGGSGTAQAGGATSIEGDGLNVTAAGGNGGRNGAISRLQPHGGQASHYGAGGTGGGNQSSGGNAPYASHGAGGGGAGGDAPGLFDHSGNAGVGGNAGVRKTGTVILIPNTVLILRIGQQGFGSTAGGNYRGGNGASGYVRFQVGTQITEFPNFGTYVYEVPSS